MANPEQVERLKAGIEGWNLWRAENPEAEIDLVQVDLSHANLVGVNLFNADLRQVNFHKANISQSVLENTLLSGANFSQADLYQANLNNADLSRTKFSGANVNEATLIRAVLFDADFQQSNLSKADLRNATLLGAEFFDANLNSAEISGADFTGAILGNTNLSRIDLSKTDGLLQSIHSYPSTIGTDTIHLSKGKIPEIFLRGCGLSDWEIESTKLYRPDLSNEEINEIIYKIFDLRARRAIQISPLFISYSHADTPFVEKLENQYTEMGIRYWRDVHHATAGRLEKQIDHAMRHNPTVLLVLSENSVNSDWVEHEARLARELEKDLKRDVLCPVALDDSWKTCNWPKRLMEQITEYHVLDFSKWEDNGTFERMFGKMISGLDMFYKK